MKGMSTEISNNVVRLLKKNGKKQNDLADALGVSKQVISNMINGNRMINAVELSQMASFFNVKMEDLVKTSGKSRNAIRAFMGEVKSPEAKESLEIADKLATMILYYARVRENGEKMNCSWEA